MSLIEQGRDFAAILSEGEGAVKLRVLRVESAR